MKRGQKLRVIFENIYRNCNLAELLEWVNNQGRNMVVSSTGRIMFNKAGTLEAHGSYKEAFWDMSTPRINGQPKQTIDFVYSLCK